MNQRNLRTILIFVAGLIVGSMMPTAYAHLERGFLKGWDVTFNGRTICEDPYAYPRRKELVCD